jgi:hypothetical protein
MKGKVITPRCPPSLPREPDLGARIGRNRFLLLSLSGPPEWGELKGVEKQFELPRMRNVTLVSRKLTPSDPF